MSNYVESVTDFDGRIMGYVQGYDGENKIAIACPKNGGQRQVAYYDRCCDVTRYNDGSGRQRRGESGLITAICEAYDRG